MSSITEQFSAAAKSQLEAQFQLFNTFASTAVASAEKVLALNLSAAKATVEKSSAAVNKLLTEPQQFFSLSAAEPPSFDKLLAYGRELASIAAAAQSELIKSTQNGIKQVTQVTDLAAAPATVAPKTPPAPAIVAKTETPPANEPVAAPPAPKAVKAPAKPKPAAAPITAAEKPIEVKVAVKPSFPAPPPKPSAKLKK
jgi:phasin family protein